MGELDGKIALITGSTAGIGRALARGFAEAGARVWVHGLEVDAGQQLADQIGGRFVAGDLSDTAAVEQIARTLTDAEDHLDVLVNNAGIEITMPLEDFKLDIFDRIMQVNMRAPVYLTHLLLPLLKNAPAASIINTTSIHEDVPYPQNLAYSMSKAALGMFTREITLELSPLGIRVNNLAPGAVATDMNRAIIERIGLDKFAEWIPLGRVAETDDMVGPAVFLASDASRYVTGTTLFADGGYRRNLVRYRY